MVDIISIVESFEIIYLLFLSEISSANDYMIKSSWNSVILDGSISQGEIERMMDNSFMLVVSKMTKKDH